MGENNWHEIAKEFCDEESWRYDMQAPWVSNGVLYATDARALIAVPVPGEPDGPPSEKKRPNAAKIVGDTSGIDVSNAWPSEFEACPKCGQSGEETKYSRRCSDCNGEGEVECDLGHMHECEECDGIGTKPAKSNGKGVTVETVPCGCEIRLGCSKYARAYIRKISEKIPGPLLWGQTSEHLRVHGADGVVVVLCPLRD